MHLLGSNTTRVLVTSLALSLALAGCGTSAGGERDAQADTVIAADARDGGGGIDVVATDSGGGADTATGTDTSTGTDSSTGTDAGTGTDSSTGTDAGTDTDSSTGTDSGMVRNCGGIAGLRCNDTEFCDFPPEAVCGRGDFFGVCTPRPSSCSRELRPVCGCDGTTHSNECAANAAGTDVAMDGACGGTTPCTAQDARAVGDCARFLGYAWDGMACQGLSGCSCAGSDCASIYSSETECQSNYRACSSTRDCRTTGCPPRQNCQECRSTGGTAHVCLPDGTAC